MNLRSTAWTDPSISRFYGATHLHNQRLPQRNEPQSTGDGASSTSGPFWQDCLIIPKLLDTGRSTPLIISFRRAVLTLRLYRELYLRVNILNYDTDSSCPAVS